MRVPPAQFYFQLSNSLMAFDKNLLKRSAQTAQPLKEVFREFLRRYQIDQKFDETYLIVFWEKIMGPTIANRTAKLYIRDKVLFVTLNSAPLKQELSHSKSTIMDLFEKEVGKGVIKEIVFH